VSAGAETRWSRFKAEMETALAHHRAGRIDRAAAIYRRIVDKSPDHADALHMLGVIATSRGRPEHAIQLIERAMGVLANYPDAHLNLGNAHHVAGRPQKAIECYRRAVALKPDFAIAHSSLGRELNGVSAFTEALPHCERAIALEPRMAEAWLHAGIAMQGLGRLGDAQAALHQALSLRQNFAKALERLGLIAIEEARFEQASEWYDRVVALRPNDARAYRLLAVALFRSGRTEAALAQFRRVVELEPAFAGGWTSFGWAYRALGRFGEATSCFRRALSIDPDDAEAHRSLAATGEQCAEESELERLRAQLADEAKPPGDRVAAGFAAGDFLDRADRFDEAFTCYAQANSLARQALLKSGRAYDPDAMVRRVDHLIAAYSPDALATATAAASESERPVFIVGMPRSGTTLVEQILASHSQVFGAGELTEIAEISRQLPFPQGEPEAIRQWAVAAKPLGRAYLDHLDTIDWTSARMTDKQPDNLLHLGLIATLFPAARVILCERDPRDICLSNYFQLFAGGNPWSYDLAECGHRYRQIARLTEHWRAVLPNALYSVNYESLVADLEGEARRLVAFLGLEWEPACLEFHRTERVVITQSTWQVRQRLFTRSVGRWRRYARHLGPLIEALGT